MVTVAGGASREIHEHPVEVAVSVVAAPAGPTRKEADVSVAPTCPCVSEEVTVSVQSPAGLRAWLTEVQAGVDEAKGPVVAAVAVASAMIPEASSRAAGSAHPRRRNREVQMGRG